MHSTFYYPHQPQSQPHWQYASQNLYTPQYDYQVDNQLPPIGDYYYPVVSTVPVYPSNYSMKSYNIFKNRFSTNNSNRYHQSNYDDAYQLQHEQQLNRNLERSGFNRLPVKGDGNCLFYALAEGLAYEMRIDKDFGSKILTLMNLSYTFKIVDFADKLRQLCVDQWKKNEDYYQNFIDKKISFLKEVKKFSKSGVSESTLGDIVPLTICNTLNINITIFTSVLELPLIEVKPDQFKSSQSSRKTIYLAYNQHGLGHYDAAYRN